MIIIHLPEPYDTLIWIMLLVVSLHSVAIAVFLFEYASNQLVYHKRDHYFYKFKTKKNSCETINDGNEKYKSRSFYLKKIKKHSFSFGKSIWLTWVLLFKAATKSDQPKGFTSKFMTNIWAILCLAFTASYTANLAAFMIIADSFPVFTGKSTFFCDTNS